MRTASSGRELGEEEEYFQWGRGSPLRRALWCLRQLAPVNLLAALQLLRSCLLPRLDYLLRCLHPDITLMTAFVPSTGGARSLRRPGLTGSCLAAGFDRLVSRTLWDMLGVTRPPPGHRAWHLARLPLRYGGLGLASRVDVATIAWAAAVADTAPLMRDMHPALAAHVAPAPASASAPWPPLTPPASPAPAPPPQNPSSPQNPSPQPASAPASPPAPSPPPADRPSPLSAAAVHLCCWGHSLAVSAAATTALRSAAFLPQPAAGAPAAAAADSRRRATTQSTLMDILTDSRHTDYLELIASDPAAMSKHHSCMGPIGTPWLDAPGVGATAIHPELVRLAALDLLCLGATAPVADGGDAPGGSPIEPNPHPL